MVTRVKGQVQVSAVSTTGFTASNFGTADTTISWIAAGPR